MRNRLGMGMLDGCCEEGEVSGETRETRESVWGDHPAGARHNARWRSDGLCPRRQELDVALSSEKWQQLAISGSVSAVRLQGEGAFVESTEHVVRAGGILEADIEI